MGCPYNLCIPEPGHYLAPPKFKSWIGQSKSKLIESGENYWNILIYGEVILEMDILLNINLIEENFSQK